MTPTLSDADLQRIREAVATAETQTAGEIVPYVVGRSGSYDVAVWRGASITAVLAMLSGMIVAALYDGWGLGWLYTGWGMVLVALTAGALGALATAYVPALMRLLAGDGLLTLNTHRRAIQAFVEEEVFDTRDRTGILLFVSMLEHRIEVYGDAGINAKVDQSDWAEVVARVRKGIVEQRFADGMVDAIALCGELLHRRGVEIRPDDTDELSDNVRLRDE
ncbi:MAG: hypothetical protein AAFQ86_06155 [Bacteroidota bacterium]